MEVSILHCPIPAFGSWLPTELIKQSKTVDLVSLTVSPGESVRADKSGLLNSIEFTPTLGMGSASNLLATHIEVKLRESPLTHKMFLLYNFTKSPSYLPLDIDTKKQTLRVLKLSAHLEVEHDHAH